MIAKAHAKLNLGLQVMRRRPDGYHDINTVFVRIPLADEIEILPSAGISCQTRPDLGIPQESNLAYRAAELLRERFNIDSGASISIIKNIPHGGGLGGGSSDAASVLLALNEMWGIGAPAEELRAIGLQLGSDVPFFLSEGAAVACGRGEVLDYFQFALPYSVLLVFPDIHVSTAWAYQSLAQEGFGRPEIDFKKCLIGPVASSDMLKDCLVNDFELPVFAKHPEIGMIKKKLYEAGAVFALMSGSGSTVFALFDDVNNIKTAQMSLNNYRTFYC